MIGESDIVSTQKSQGTKRIKTLIRVDYALRFRAFMSTSASSLPFLKALTTEMFSVFCSRCKYLFNFDVGSLCYIATYAPARENLCVYELCTLPKISCKDRLSIGSLPLQRSILNIYMVVMAFSAKVLN